MTPRMRYGGYEAVIREADQAYEEAIRRAAEAIAKSRDRVRLVIVAGPSSSGKTTTTMKLCEALKALGQDHQMFARKSMSSSARRCDLACLGPLWHRSVDDPARHPHGQSVSKVAHAKRMGQ